MYGPLAYPKCGVGVDMSETIASYITSIFLMIGLVNSLYMATIAQPLKNKRLSFTLLINLWILGSASLFLSLDIGTGAIYETIVLFLFLILCIVTIIFAIIIRMKNS